MPQFIISWRSLGLSVLLGLAVGVATSIFLYGLTWVSDFCSSHPAVFWFLPIVGLLIVWLYHLSRVDFNDGYPTILHAIAGSPQKVSSRMAPLMVLTTWLTHLVGGSAGREGVAVQVGGGLVDTLTGSWFSITQKERESLLIAGVGAGFSAALAVPWAGVLFGFEILKRNELDKGSVVNSILCSWLAFGVTVLLKTPHIEYPKLLSSYFSWMMFAKVTLVAIVFGMAARFFCQTTHFFKILLGEWIASQYIKAFIGGMVLVLVYFFLPESEKLRGLGLKTIQDSFVHQQSLFDAVLKSLATSVTVGSGFKGGEFTPLVFVGVVLGNVLSFVLDMEREFLVALGFGAVFAGASNTPVACAVLIAEVFGVSMLPWSFWVCWVSSQSSGALSLYGPSHGKCFDKYLHKIVSLIKLNK